jgi:adenosine deaminase
MSFNKQLFCIVLLVVFSVCTASAADNQQQTAGYYDSMFHNGKADVAELNQFFTEMPKGGDLHHHYTGSIYAETYLGWVEKKGWWINPCTLRIVTTQENGECASLTVPQLVADNALYRKLLSLWSDMDFRNHFHDQPPPDSNFFDTFGYFGPISDDYMHDGLNIIKQRAIKENVNYIETMLSSVPVSSKDYFSTEQADTLNKELQDAKTPAEIDRLLDQIAATLGNNSDFNKQVNDFVSMVDKVHQGIDNDVFMMRFQTYASRVNDPLQVFTNLYAGFIASDKSPLIVGVNIVAPENNVVALADYTLHMRMFAYLHKLYPNAHRALHAGELTLGLVPPKDLLFHIRQALEIAHAQRIGHGVDLPYEHDSTQLLAELKKTDTAIEINLTSNQFILGVAGREHPYLIYSAYGVPLVISTDDSGVSRNNLSNQYMLLASRYHPSYKAIKKYVYNSIRYSFLSEADKASAKKVLDKKFAAFEHEMAGFSEHMKH